MTRRDRLTLLAYLVLILTWIATINHLCDLAPGPSHPQGVHR